MKRLKLALIGAGPVAERYHVAAIRGVPEFKAWMAADLDVARARRVADLAPFEYAVSSLDEVLGNVDAAIVALPNGLHREVSCQLLEAGIHVLCEKPMARDVAECEEMIASAARGGAILCVGHNRRFRTNVIEATKILDAGLLGNITNVEAEEGSTSDWRRSKAYFDPALAGGGALMDVGIHSIDLIRLLVDEFADVEYEGNESVETVESHAVLRFTLANGARGRVTSSRDQNLGQRLVLRGTEGELAVGLWSLALVLQRKSGKAFQHFKELNLNPVRRALDASFVEQLHRFAKAILDGGLPPVSGYDGLKAVQVVERAYASKRDSLGVENDSAHEDFQSTEYLLERKAPSAIR
jgi:predicted dehydrogenase